MDLYDVAKTECLRCLCAYHTVAGNASCRNETIGAFKDCLTALYAGNSIAVCLASGDVAGYDVLTEQWAHRVVDKDEVVVGAASLAKTIYAIVDALHASIATRENPLQLVDIELVGIGLKDSLPSIQAYYSNGIDIWMLLEALHCMDNDGAAIDVHKLLGNVLPHTVPAATCNYQSYVFFHRNVC